MFQPQTEFATVSDVQVFDSPKNFSESKNVTSLLALDLDVAAMDPFLDEWCLDFSWNHSSESLIGRFIHRALLVPNSIAITTRSQSFTYRQLLYFVVQISDAIRATPEFQPDSRVILLLPNSVEYIAAFYGILLAGGVAVPLAQNRESQELQQIFESTGASVAIVASNHRRLPEFLSDLPVKLASSSERFSNSNEQSKSISLTARQELAAIFFTAGSTGCPKGVMLSHRNLVANALSIQQYLGIRSTDRPLCVLPFHHAYGNSVLQSHLLAGATLILDGKPMFPETLIDSIEQHRATSMSVVPDLVRMLLERTSIGRRNLPTLRYITVAGGVLCQEQALKLAERISPAQLFLMYGQTEATARLAFLPPEQLASLPAGCIGKAIPGVELQIVDEQERPVATGQVGELRARGANVMLGYWRDEDGTAEKLRDGWLFTGDLAVADHQGWIYHKGRRNALVKIAGYRVHPGVLEEFAVRRLQADQAVAVPYETPQVGTRLALFIRKSAAIELTHTEMLFRCHSELPRYLAPGMIRVVDSFPLNSVLKLDRISLSRMAAEEADRSSQKESMQPE